MTDLKQLVGEQVRKLRKMRGMTQEGLAERSNLSFSYISDVERGTRNISLESLGKIMVALGIQPIQLFEGAKDLTEVGEVTELSQKVDTLVFLLKNRSVEEVEFMIKVAREFIQTVDRK